MSNETFVTHSALEEELILEIAMAIHQEYNEKRLKEKPDVPLEYSSWDELPPDIKLSNIEQAKDIPEKLRLIGCFINHKISGTPPIIFFEEDEIEVLAIHEHERWIKERKASGWIYGKTKDVQKKISPYLAPWDKIPDNIKKYDVETVTNIIPLLRGVNLYVYRHVS